MEFRVAKAEFLRGLRLAQGIALSNTTPPGSSSMGEDAAVRVLGELALDVARQAAAVGIA